MLKRSIIGPALMLIGVFLYFNQGQSFGAGAVFANFWASMFIIPLGLFFHWLYFGVTGGKGVGLLIPGGILFTVGLVCQLSTLFSAWHILWPGFILAVAVGLFEFYWFGNRNKWLLIPINILAVLSLLFFGVFSLSAASGQLATVQPLLAIALIIVGAFAMLSRKKEQ
ncbi:hypothetical protein ABEW34_19315 [Paenibacillus algorifonticola]|uniref:hypothetical protein n=1 Tax=Paenibacillus algorifonticola TaxID=684063 RepID=UPI003D266E62